MFARKMGMVRWFVRHDSAQHALETLRLIVAAAFLFASAGPANASVIARDFFGSTDDFGNGILTRHDAAGNTVLMGSGQQGPTLIGIDGLRAQIPDSSAEVWRAPGGRHAATWFFAASSTDSFEPVTPGDVNNLALVAGADAGTGGHEAALLPLASPSGPIKVSADMIPEGGDLRDWVAIGFTSSVDAANLTSNFENFGQVWLLLKMNATGLGPTTWELHTAGLAGPTLTGNATLTGNYIPMELTYDPVAHLARGSINGIPTPTISYSATGIDGVGMEALQHISFGVADDFEVQTAPGLTPTAGDYNNDGMVDAGDCIIWRKGLGTIFTQTDYDIWRANFGQTAGIGTGASGNTAVPEPGIFVLLVTGMLAICSCVRFGLSQSRLCKIHRSSKRPSGISVLF